MDQFGSLGCGGAQPWGWQQASAYRLADTDTVSACFVDSKTGIWGEERKGLPSSRDCSRVLTHYRSPGPSYRGCCVETRYRRQHAPHSRPAVALPGACHAGSVSGLGRASSGSRVSNITSRAHHPPRALKPSLSRGKGLKPQQQYLQAAPGLGQGWVCSRLSTSRTSPLISSFPNRVMEVWHGVVIAVVSLILQACLLAVINYLLSRHMGNWLGVLFPPGPPQGPFPIPQQDEPPNIT